jgi:hypothetical protein
MSTPRASRVARSLAVPVQPARPAPAEPPALRLFADPAPTFPPPKERSHADVKQVIVRWLNEQL